jgi:hypothetical protein
LGILGTSWDLRLGSWDLGTKSLLNIFDYFLVLSLVFIHDVTRAFREATLNYKHLSAFCNICDIKKTHIRILTGRF